MQDADFEELLDEKFRAVTQLSKAHSIAPAVVTEVKRQQRLSLIRPCVVLLAAIVGLMLSWPGILGMFDLSWFAVLLTEMSQTTSGFAAIIAETMVGEISSPLAMSLGLICVLAFIAVAAES